MSCDVTYIDEIEVSITETKRQVHSSSGQYRNTVPAKDESKEVYYRCRKCGSEAPTLGGVHGGFQSHGVAEPVTSTDSFKAILNEDDESE